MKKLFLILATVSVLAVSGCAPQVDMEAERAAIHAFHDECLAAFRIGDVDCFAEDGQALPHGVTVIKGRSAIGELVSQMLEDPNFSFSHDVVNIEVSRSGDLAYIHYTYEQTMSDPDGSPITEHGKGIFTLKKQSQEEWKILIDIWNANDDSLSDSKEIAPIDTEALNKQLVREVFSAIDEQDYVKLKTLWPEDMKCFIAGLPEPMSRDETIEFISNWYTIFPDYTHEIQEVVADGNKVMIRVTNHATHQNEFEGSAPTGKKIAYEAVHMVTIEGGAISEWWLLEDDLGFKSQLGMKFVPAEVGG